jgi:hypothetical protein
MPDTPFYADPLDLLLRFTPTPLKAVYHIDSLRVMVETNDFSLLPKLPLNSSLEKRHEQTLQWKLIRDSATFGLLEQPMLLVSGTMTVVTMGTACLLALDRERRELLGFIGAGVDARTHQEFLIPFLCRLSSDMAFGFTVSHSTNSNRELVND